MTQANVTVTPEATPNPDSYKFVFNQEISQETMSFNDPLQSSRSPLAHKIFGFPWVDSVFIGQNFVSINKQDWVDWDMIAEPLANLLKEHIDDGLPVFADLSEKGEESQSNTSETPKHTINPDDPEIINKIKNFLDQEIRPFVAMDGGDVNFHKFNDDSGVLEINMTGACNGCPSSTATLKMGIESRIQDIIPEVKEVISV